MRRKKIHLFSNGELVSLNCAPRQPGSNIQLTTHSMRDLKAIEANKDITILMSSRTLIFSWVPWSHKALTTELFVYRPYKLTTKKTTKPIAIGTLRWASTHGQCITPTKGKQMRKTSLKMPSRDIKHYMKLTRNENEKTFILVCNMKA